ncbi:MAG: hypothetical protein ACI9YB_003408, partial [Halioglobus sp.]
LYIPLLLQGKTFDPISSRQMKLGSFSYTWRGRWEKGEPKTDFSSCLCIHRNKFNNSFTRPSQFNN